MEADLLQLLRDQIWQFIGALLGLVSILVNLVQYWQKRDRKELVARTFYRSLIPDAVSGTIETLFNGEAVNDIMLATATLENSGNLPITPDDFVNPITLTFGTEAQILSAEIIAQEPSNLGASLTVEPGQVIVDPTLLLNPKDFLTVSAVGTALTGIGVNARIVGLKNIGYGDTQSIPAKAYLLSALLVAGLSIAALVLHSSFLWGFLVAGIVGWTGTQVRFYYKRW